MVVHTRDHLWLYAFSWVIQHRDNGRVNLKQEFSEFIRAGIMFWTQSKNVEYGLTFLLPYSGRTWEQRWEMVFRKPALKIYKLHNYQETYFSMQWQQKVLVAQCKDKGDGGGLKILLVEIAIHK